jgi:5-oxoprolinase (ATP-hydrolysing)
VCYRKGGTLSITDANLVLGRLVPSLFPKIFGPGANEPLDQEASVAAFSKLTATINAQRPKHPRYTLYEVAAGFIKIANEGMSRPMRKLTEQKGHSIASHDLCCFGGWVVAGNALLICRAGGQHACAIAQGLGIETVIVPRHSSILSAYGIACANLTDEAATPLTGEITDDFASSSLYGQVLKTITQLKDEVKVKLGLQGLAPQQIDYIVRVGVQYDGADSVFQLLFDHDLKDRFIALHLRETSFSLKRKVRLSGIRVVGSGKSMGPRPSDFNPELSNAMNSPREPEPSAVTQLAYFEVSNEIVGMDTPVYSLDHLASKTRIRGPAIIADSTQTIVIEPSVDAFILTDHVILRLPKNLRQPDNDATLDTDPVTLGVFSNRFMSIAEQMGHTLQRTSISVSIKERLDFSCSIHGTDGALVANAPHIPIHLGSMQFAVTAQHNHWLGRLRLGDVLLTNHPKWGGTHLPDLTVVTPIFGPDDATKVLFYVASRGHHTDM